MQGLDDVGNLQFGEANEKGTPQSTSSSQRLTLVHFYHSLFNEFPEKQLQ